MDNRYLDLLAEECAEVIQAIMKAKRFGMDDCFEGYNEGRPNADAILREIGDVFAVVTSLCDADELDVIFSARDAKNKKLETYGPDGTYIAQLEAEPTEAMIEAGVNVYHNRVAVVNIYKAMQQARESEDGC